MQKSALLMTADASSRMLSTMTPSVSDKISMQSSLINSGVDNVAAIIGLDISITNGCLGRYLQPALVLTVTLCRLGERCLIQKKAQLRNRLPGWL